MSRKLKITSEERIAAVKEYFDGKGSIRSISKKYGFDKSSFRDLVLRAKLHGIESVKISSASKKYSKETKLNAVLEYLNEKESKHSICAKYQISCTSVLRRWIKWYNSGNELKGRTSLGRGITMNKGRNTTQEERVEIVAYCIENGKNYRLAMAKYSVSYKQIYAWVRKYEEKGVEGLSDRRGKAKPENELTDADRLRMENKILQAKIKDMEMENALLKKIRELEGWRY